MDKYSPVKDLATSAGKMLATGGRRLRAAWNGERRCAFFGCRSYGDTIRDAQHYCRSHASAMRGLQGFSDHTPQHRDWQTMWRWAR